MKTHRFEGINYGYQPDSYWDMSGLLQTILVNVKGTERRRMIREHWEAGRMEQLADMHLLDSLSEDERERLGAIHPAFMGGEYLPDYDVGGVEIARVELESTTSDVISVRAAPQGSRIAYSVVDEYETEFKVLPETSEKPLSLEELAALMDGAVDGDSLGTFYTLFNYRSGTASLNRLDELRSFTRVSSEFYPQLSDHYKNVTDLWYEQEKGKIEGSKAAE